MEKFSIKEKDIYNRQKVSFHLVCNEIGLRVSVGHMEPLLYVLLSYGY